MKPVPEIFPGGAKHMPGDPHSKLGVSRQCANGQARLVFAQYNADPLSTGTSSPVPPFKVDQMIKAEYVGEGENILPWIVNLWAFEVERVAGLGAPVNPLGLSEIRRGSIFSRYKARVEWGGGNIRDVDFGQSFRISTPSRFITVSTLLPPNNASFVNPEPGNPNQPSLAGVVTDTLFGVEVQPTTSLVGRPGATHTQTITIPQTVVDQFIALPPGTRSVSIYQTGVGDPITGFWSLTSTPAAVAFNLGSVVVSGADLRALDLIRPGNAEGIATGPADIDDDRVITVVSHLEI